MKRKVLLVMMGLVLVVGLFASGCGLFGGGEARTRYVITAEWVEADKSLNASMEVEYYNNTEAQLESVVFHLYPNAYRQTAELSPISDLKIDEAYPNGISYGDITITKLTVNGKEQAVSVGGVDANILTVALKSKLKPEDSVKIGMEFCVKLANVRHRLGYFAKTVNLGNFYPIAAVYENGEFDQSPYCYIGDPFYSEAADYEVSILAPVNYTAAASGALKGREVEGEKVRSHFTGECMRDFALVLGELTEVSEMVGDVKVNYYYNVDARVVENMQTAVDALVTFNNLFGKYPFKTLSVVKTAFLQGGMEYPGLVYISDSLNASSFTETIIHEIAHQWWACGVGNNQNKEAWLDEGLSEYSVALFYEANPAYNVTLKQRMAGTLSGFMLYLEIHKHNGLDDTSMNRALSEYSGEMEYSYLVYAQGEIMLNAIREMIGKDSFLAALQSYYKANNGKIARPEHLIGALESASKRELAAYVESWTLGNTQAYA